MSQPGFTGGIFKGLIYTALLLSVYADSKLFSSSYVFSQFQNHNRYFFAAAELGLPEASWLAFRRTSNGRYLHYAIKGNHPEAVFFWYREQKKVAPHTSDIWLEQAMHLGVSQAYLERLNLLVARKAWQEAERLIAGHSANFEQLEPEDKTRFIQLQELIELALKPALAINPMETKGQTIDWQSKRQMRQTNCAISTKVVVANNGLLESTEALLQKFQQSRLSELGVCFNNPAVDTRLNSICNRDGKYRLDCDLAKLAISQKQSLLVENESFSHLLVVMEHGEANTRGGLMFLDKEDSIAVLLHEVAHWLGHVDEYRIEPAQQRLLCSASSPTWIGENVVVAPKVLPQVRVEEFAKHKLFITNTCNGSQLQAYKVFPDASFMEFLDLAISDQHIELLKKNIGKRNHVPAAMNFALAFKLDDINSLSKQELQQAKVEYRFWLERAALWHFPPAMRMLAQEKISQGKYLEASQLLDIAAENSDANAQLLLGHSYLEGRWLPRDLTQSAFWYQQAALQNDPFGLYFYGKCLEMGWGCTRSASSAMEYYQRAAALGNQLAIRRLTAK